MKITHEQIADMVKNYPNDAELGRSIRELMFRAQKANEVYISPSQPTSHDSINEIQNNGNGPRY